MEDNIIGSAVFRLEIDSSPAKTTLSAFPKEVAGALANSTAETKSLSSAMADATIGVNNLKQAFSGLSSIGNSIASVIDAHSQYEASMNGLASVARATGNSIAESMQVVKESTSSGLLSQADSAAAVKNLELYGYSAQQSAQMIDVLTNAAVYNRQSNYSLSEAVRVTTEGIRMENSVLSDAAGVQKNIAKMHEEYAQQLGKTTDQLTQAEKAQAVYNGVMAEGGIFAGNAEDYTNTLAGSQSKLGNALNTVKQDLGGIFDELAPVINGVSDWISENRSLVAGIVTFIGILGVGSGLIGAIALAKKAITSIISTISTLKLISGAATGGIVGLVVSIAAIGGAYAAAKVFENISSATEDFGDNADTTTEDLDRLNTKIDNTAKRVAELGDQLNKLNRDYQRDLKKIAVDHQKNLDSLTAQIEEANVEYRRAIDERNAEFSVSFAKQEREHQELVDELTTQLNFLHRYNNNYNKQKLAQVQFALAKEQNLYQQETAAQQAQIALQNAADKAKLDQKLLSLQQELDDENAFMQKHREQLNSVRDVILLDEVESLNERYQEQKKSYEKQIIEAKNSGISAANSYDQGWNDAKQNLTPDVDTDLSAQGRAACSSWTEGFREWMGQGGIVADIWKLILGEETYNKWMGKSVPKPKYSGGAGTGGGGSGWASGGYTGPGPVDEIAGVVHRGEYVIPASQVDQSSGLPKNNQPQNITINLSGVLADSPSAKRALAMQLANAMNEVMQSRLLNNNGVAA